jgi:hypothetical protein
MTQDLQNKIMRVAKENAQIMEQKSGTEPSLTDEEITNYQNRVIDEVKQKGSLGRGFKSHQSTFTNLVEYGIELSLI